MATITLKGIKINTLGSLPDKGRKAPHFELTKSDLSTVTLSDYKGSKMVLNIFPSIDTGTCAQYIRQFNQEAAELENTIVLYIFKDLPFAQAHFCGTEGLENVEMLSYFKDGNFGKTHHVDFSDGPMAPLYSWAVVMLDANGKILYTEQVCAIMKESNYKAA